MRAYRIRLAAIATALAVWCAAVAAQPEETLTNEHVIRMTGAQLGVPIIRSTIEASNVRFDLSPAGLIALKNAGVSDDVILAMQARTRALAKGATTTMATRQGPEKSELLAASKDPEFILRNFRTMLVDASRAAYFGTPQMKAALGDNKNFESLRISLVDDPAVADVVLTVNYTFAWDYPFALRHQNTSVVLLSGKGVGPFSGPAGANDVAAELAKALKPYRPK